MTASSISQPATPQRETCAVRCNRHHHKHSRDAQAACRVHNCLAGQHAGAVPRHPQRQQHVAALSSLRSVWVAAGRKLSCLWQAQALHTGRLPRRLLRSPTCLPPRRYTCPAIAYLATACLHLWFRETTPQQAAQPQSAHLAILVLQLCHRNLEALGRGVKHLAAELGIRLQFRIEQARDPSLAQQADRTDGPARAWQQQPAQLGQGRQQSRVRNPAGSHSRRQRTGSPDMDGSGWAHKTSEAEAHPTSALLLPTPRAPPASRCPRRPRWTPTAR